MPGFDSQLPFDDELPPDDDLKWEIPFFEGIVKSSPNYVEALVNLGNLYTRNGDFDKGLAIDKRLVKLCPEDPITHYNLACSLSLLSYTDEALAELEKAIELGYSDYAYLLRDEDLDNVRRDPRFLDLMGKFHKPV